LAGSASSEIVGGRFTELTVVLIVTVSTPPRPSYTSAAKLSVPVKLAEGV